MANDAKCDVKKADIFAKKAILREKQEKVPESERCLSCLVVCENCVEAIENAEKLLNQLFDGEMLSEDLQLTDNGQLTYVESPAG